MANNSDSMMVAEGAAVTQPMALYFAWEVFVDCLLQQLLKNPYTFITNINGVSEGPTA